MAGTYFTALGIAAAVALGGCAMQKGGQGGTAGAPMGAQGAGQAGMPMPGAMATLTPTRGNEATGVATFYERNGQVMMHARLTGLRPNAEHGFHIHERGDCSAPDASSAGGHYNPAGRPHGAPGGASHAGDLPNLKTDARGNAEMRIAVPEVTLDRGPMRILDRALVVHAQPDDYRSQPSGDSGARIACGVIGQAVPPPR